MKEITELKYRLSTLQEELEKNNCEKEELKNKLADITNEMNQFTYIVSHDLQAPLRTITGFMELLEKRYADKLDDAALQYIDFAKNGTVKMKKLVLDLLEYSRLSSDTKEFAEVDLNETISEVKEKYLTGTLKEAGVVITADHLPIVKADKTLIKKLFQHLLENAIKFRSTAAPEINITAKMENNFCRIAVKDNGMGIDPAYSEKIFIIFRRLHADEKKYSGTGAGLALCKKIVELHGGIIWVEPVADKGSSFCFTLPVKS